MAKCVAGLNPGEICRFINRRGECISRVALERCKHGKECIYGSDGKLLYNGKSDTREYASQRIGG